MKLILQAIKALFRKIEASRTHWEEVEEVEILTETTVTIPVDNSDASLPLFLRGGGYVSQKSHANQGLNGRKVLRQGLIS